MMLNESNNIQIDDVLKMSDQLNSDLNDLMRTPTIPKEYSNPYMHILASGVNSESALGFLFSDASNSAVNTILDIIGGGDFSKLNEAIPKIQKMFELNGVGDGMFKCEIGTRIIDTIKRSMNS